MGLRIRLSRQTLTVLDALLSRPGQWLHGYSLSQSTGIPSGTLYPILMRLEKLHWLETRWKRPEHQGGRRGTFTAWLELRGSGLGKRFVRRRSGVFGSLRRTRHERWQTRDSCIGSLRAMATRVDSATLAGRNTSMGAGARCRNR